MIPSNNAQIQDELKFSESQINVFGKPDEPAESYVDKDGEWKNRKINLFKVVKGFISQLKLGQDLTKVSLPAEVCTPYGLLEVMGSREISKFHLLFDLNKEQTELGRFLSALRFFLATVPQEKFEKKPWNPVLGENHITWVDHDIDDRTIFVGEQVSHHPPMSAFNISNIRQEITCDANICFTVNFGGNQVTVATSGALSIHAKKVNETYELTKYLPEMVIKNVVWGKKYIIWVGEVIMNCPQTGYKATLRFKEKDNQNVVNGEITKSNKPNETIIHINGVCGQKIFTRTPLSKENNLLIDLIAEYLPTIHYLPWKKLQPLSSVAVWGPVNKAIVDDNIDLADQEKKVIEQEQRERFKKKVENNLQSFGQFFNKNTDEKWALKDQVDILEIIN